MKILDLNEIKRQKKKELNRRKSNILDSIEKLIEKIIHSELDEKTISILEKFSESCEMIYSSLNKGK